MSITKYCPECQETITCTFDVNYCCWCGKDLRNEKPFPKFPDFEQQKQFIQSLKIGLNSSQTHQLQLF